jgi:hypothetical protein
MTAYRSARSLALFTVVALLASCDGGPQPPVSTKRSILQSYESTSYADAAKQRRFKEALEHAGVPHEIYTGDDGNQYVRWKGEDGDRVEGIKISLFGKSLPEGRHIHFGALHQEQFKEWLTANGIAFTTQQSDGKEYVIWEAADYPRLARWEHFPRDSYEKGQRLSSNPAFESGPPSAAAQRER